MPSSFKKKKYNSLISILFHFLFFFFFLYCFPGRVEVRVDWQKKKYEFFGSHNSHQNWCRKSWGLISDILSFLNTLSPTTFLSQWGNMFPYFKSHFLIKPIKTEIISKLSFHKINSYLFIKKIIYLIFLNYFILLFQRF